MHPYMTLEHQLVRQHWKISVVYQLTCSACMGTAKPKMHNPCIVTIVLVAPCLETCLKLRLALLLYAIAQAAKLLCSFREYHRRAALGLASFYSNKLAALEDGLLNAREKLFSVHEEVQEQGQDAEQLLAAVAAVAQAEREVAEVRQLREEEETHLLGAVEAMSQLWKQLCEVRKQQGGMRLTDLGFSVVQLPRDDATPMQAVSVCNHPSTSGCCLVVHLWCYDDVVNCCGNSAAKSSHMGLPGCTCRMA